MAIGNDGLPIDRNLEYSLLLQLKQEIVARILCNVRLYSRAQRRFIQPLLGFIPPNLGFIPSNLGFISTRRRCGASW